MATSVRERPIVMSADEVRRVLAGATQLRRPVKESWQGLPLDNPDYAREAISKCPLGVPGDSLFVREAWCELDRDHWWDPSKPRDWLYSLGGKHGPRRRLRTR